MDTDEIDQAIDILSKKYEVVVILCSSHENRCTSYWTRGYGNNFAREAMCNNYVENQSNGRLAHEIDAITNDGDEYNSD